MQWLYIGVPLGIMLWPGPRDLQRHEEVKWPKKDKGKWLSEFELEVKHK